jgi:hypothetical protein
MMIRLFFLMQVFAQITVKYSFQVEFGIGEWVTFKGVEGMTQLNGVEVKVRMRSPAVLDNSH